MSDSIIKKNHFNECNENKNEKIQSPRRFQNKTRGMMELKFSNENRSLKHGQFFAR